MSRRTQLLLGVLLVCVLAVAWYFLFSPPENAEKATGESLGSGGWLVLAAIAGAVFTSLGAYLNDFYTRRREDARAEREAMQQRQQWEREDRLRREEKEEADRQQVREARAHAYKAFVAATTFPGPFEETRKAEYTRELNERYTDVLLYCSNYLAGYAEELYNSARTALSHSEDGDVGPSPLRQKLKEAQAEFWDAVRVEARRDYSHS